MRSKHSHALVNMVKAKIIFNFIKPAFKGLVWSNKMHSWAQKIEFWVKMAHLYIYIYKISVDPAFWLMRFHSMASSIFIQKMILFIRKWLGVATYFCFIFKRINKIRKKTLSVTLYFGKGGLCKIGSSLGVRLPIGKVRKRP